IEQQQKNLVCTELGRKLVETFPIHELFDLELTGRLEKALSDIEKRNRHKQEFLRFVFDFILKSVETVKGDQDIIINHMASAKISKETLENSQQCRYDIVEGKKGFGCSNWKSGCKFVGWKNDKYLATMKKKPTKTMVNALLKNGTAHVKGLTSKRGNK